MNTILKAKLIDHLQAWLEEDEIADSLGSIHGIWQDNTNSNRNATLMATACEIVIDSMELQYTLEKELGGN